MVAIWQRRDLGTRRYVHVPPGPRGHRWADGVYFTPRLDHDRQCLLVLIGADADGRKELLAIDDGYRESKPALAGLRGFADRMKGLLAFHGASCCFACATKTA